MDIEIRNWSDSPVYKTLQSPNLREGTITADNGKVLTFSRRTNDKHYVVRGFWSSERTVFTDVQRATEAIENWLEVNRT